MRRREAKAVRLGRRKFIRRAGALALASVLPRPAAAAAMLDAGELGVVAGSGTDQTATLAAAMTDAVARGRPLFLPAGDYRVADLAIPSNVTILGWGRARLIPAGARPLAVIASASNIDIDGVIFSGEGGAPGGDQGLLEVTSSERISIRNCRFVDSRGDGLRFSDAGAAIERCDVSGQAGAGIFSIDSRGLMITGTLVEECGNGGILIWGSAPRRDGSIVMGNVIQNIRADAGGNGQNGNGINVFRCGQVIIADNQIDNCAFSAVRLNAAKNTQVRGNACIDSGEVAIFSEFGFSGSIIADNVVDGAAGGISMTNFDQGGRLATCSGNIVRNITPASAVNPDTTPFGIAAEADAVVSGNAVDSVPGVGIAAGWGPYLRNVVITGNTVRDVEVGIAVSVAEGAGRAVVTGNNVSEARRAGIAGTAWTDIRTADLERDAGNYPQLRVSGNSVG
jgi:uncharacterized secreted repeat protein (TIGR03808 family)